jgi:hypothetical protein
MRNIKIILFILLYLCATIGLHGSMHYCGGEISSIAVNGIEEGEKCGCDKETMSESCCSEKGFSYKINDESFKVPVLRTINVFQNLDLFLPDLFIHFTNFFNKQVVSHNSHHPPDDVKLLSIYILYRVFRI